MADNVPIGLVPGQLFQVEPLVEYSGFETDVKETLSVITTFEALQMPALDAVMVHWITFPALTDAGPVLMTETSAELLKVTFVVEVEVQGPFVMVHCNW